MASAIKKQPPIVQNDERTASQQKLPHCAYCLVHTRISRYYDEKSAILRQSYVQQWKNKASCQPPIPLICLQLLLIVHFHSFCYIRRPT